MRPERKGQDKVPAARTCGWGEGRALRPHPRPWTRGGPGAADRAPSSRLPLRASALTADRGVELGPRVGGALTSLGCRDSGLRATRTARGAVPFGLPADRNPGAASSFGERSRRRGPRARGGAELGRGRAGGEGGGRRAGGGARGSRPGPCPCPGLSRAPSGSRSLHRSPGRLPLRLPLPRLGKDPFPPPFG